MDSGTLPPPPQLQAWAQDLSLPFCVLTPAIWGGYWATTTTMRSVLLWPVADRKTRSSVDVTDWV